MSADMDMWEGPFRVDALDKIEYRWKTEIKQPPKWLGEPYPWDWMLVATRI